MAKNQIRIFKKKITKSSKKHALHLIKNLKKASLKCTFVRALRFRGKKPQGLCALCFALKRTLSVLFTTLLAIKSQSKKWGKSMSLLERTGQVWKRRRKTKKEKQFLLHYIYIYMLSQIAHTTTFSVTEGQSWSYL